MEEINSAIRAFVLRIWGENSQLPSDLTNDTDLFGCLGIDGDDAFEFADEFGREFGVDMSGYRWYFHHGEEGLGLGGIFFPPPNRRVTAIPITIQDLVLAAQTNKWPIEYPKHALPGVRWDLHFNQAIGFLIIGGIVLWAWQRFGP